MEDKRHTTTVTTTKVNVRKALEAAGAAELTHEEERILRMRSGSSLAPSDRLELKGQEHPEARAKLAMIERLAMEAMRIEPPPRARRSESAKGHIVDRLRRETSRK